MDAADVDLIRRERDLLAKILAIPHNRHARPLLSEALRIAVEATGADQGYLAVYDLGQQDYAKPRWWIGHRLDEAEVETIQRSSTARNGMLRCVVRNAMENNVMVTVFRPEEDPRFKFSDSVRSSSVDAVMCAAIGAGPTGVLYLYKERDHGQFEKPDLRLIEQYRTFLAPLVDRILAEATSVEDPTEPHRRDGRFSNFLGRSRGIADVLRRANQAANFNDQVLLLGPTGTGKSHLARSIHEASPRAHGPFIEVNLTAIPAGLFECELFGVHRNAGVHAEREGFVSLARGGTLFLDEAAEIAPDLQVKLNQFMSTRQYHAVGDDRQQVADVRLIVATNRNLEDDVQSGKVRADYCFRLSAGHVITLPALNARPEDVPLLMDAVGREYAAANQRPWMGFTPRALVSAMAAAWPGNIRDLQGTVRRGFAETGGLVPIDAPHLFGTPRIAVSADETPRDFLPWMEATHRFKLDYFRRAYLHFQGDRAQIIEALDIRNALFFDYRSQLLDQQLTTTEPGSAPLRSRRPKDAGAPKKPAKRGRKPIPAKPSSGK